MPRTTIVEIPPAEQARMLAELRRARYGYLLALHLLLLCAAGRTPSEMASRALLFALQRLSGGQGVPGRNAHASTEATEHAAQRRRLRLLTPSLKRSVQALLKTAPRAVWVVSHAVELCDD